MNVEIKDGIHWIGAVDWNVRDFHGYETFRGTSYNAYLIQDEKTALIDTVKAPFADRLIGNIANLTAPENVDYLVINHAEIDHSGAAGAVVDACSDVTVIMTGRTRDILGSYHDISDWRIEIVTSGDTLSLGDRTLTFIETPMVHWPDSGMTYVPEQQLLLSNDAFGQHYASSSRFDDTVPLDVLMWEAKTYYANIVMPFGRRVSKTLQEASELDIEMIAPAHGIIWRSHVGDIVSAYSDWAEFRPQPKVLVMYDTMWQSTEQMARAIVEGATAPGVTAKMLHVRRNSHTVLATEVLDAAAIAVGSPTLNQTLMPQAAALLTYLTGLAPRNKVGLAFGSHGWQAGGQDAVNEYLTDMKLEVVREPVTAQYRPTAQVLDECREAGKILAGRAKQMAADDD